MPVSVQRDRDASVAEIGRKSFGIDARGDHQGCACVPALVEADRIQPSLGPGTAGTTPDPGAREGLGRRAPEGKTGKTTCCEAVLDEMPMQDIGDWDPAPPCSGLRLHVLTCRLVPGAFDVNDALLQIDVFPTQGLELPAPWACVSGCRPQSAILGRERSE